MNKQSAPYGCWPSMITSELLTQGVKRLSEPQIVGKNSYWLESRPQDKGRTVLVCRDYHGRQRDLTPSTMSVRSRAHEYGGGSYCVDNEIVYFINDSDQRIYKIERASKTPIPLTPEGAYRYSDFCIDQDREQLICVCEIHKPDQEPENCIIAVKLDGSSTLGFNLLVFGNDFYSNPRLSPDGEHLSWLTWNHPNMPWDNSECWLAEFSSLGLLQKHRKVAGGSDDGSRNESIFQPQWSPNGALYFVSDRNQWWNLYRYNLTTKVTTVVLEMEAEFATPQWVFGMSTYGFINSYTLFCCYTQDGQWHAATIDTLTQHFMRLVLPYNHIEAVSCDLDTDTALFLAADSQHLPRIVQWCRGEVSELAVSGNLPLDHQHFSKPEAINFTNSHQHIVHGFYYPPYHPHYQGEDNTLPPLLVMCHGGPTGATSSALNLKIQYWTSRGFAVLDVNYSGSTGYGRDYRNRLKEQWGLLDVDDICSGARHLIEQQRVDGQRTLVRGSSAGGYTVLAALTFETLFKAGASLYGIGDLSLLAQDTHKFEARYLDQLIGPWPESRDKYQARSPINHTEKLNCPVIFLQGLKDKVVPPNQAEAMVDTLAQKQIPVAYVTFADEGHGFRQAENIRHAIEMEYAFYCSIFQLTPAELLPSVPFLTAEKG